MNILKFMSVDDVLKIKKSIKSGKSVESIAKKYSKLSQANKTALLVYIQKVKDSNDLDKSTILGHKDEPYYENEQDMMNPPKYNWASLPKDEKSFYNVRVKNGKKMD